MNLNQVTVPVLNVPESIRFYQILGLKLIVHTHDNYARFECPDGDSTFSIHKVDKMPQEPLTYVYFETEKLGGLVHELKEKGIEFILEPQEQSWKWIEARLKDPSGNVLILYRAGKHRKNPPWRVKDGE